MKKLAAVLFLIASLNARADLLIVENMQVGGQGQDMTMKIKGDKARVDVGNGQISTILDIQTGDMVTLIHTQKMFMKVSGAKAKELIEQMKKAQGNNTDPVEPPKIADSGKKEKVGDYNTEIYTAEMQGAKFKFWVTKDIPDYVSIQAQMKKLQGLQEKFGQKAPDTSKIDGIPVKTETTMANGQVLTMTLTLIKNQPVDDTDLVPPPDYHEMQMPEMPQMPAGGAGQQPPPPPPVQQ